MIPGNVDQLVYTAGTHYGQTAYLFDINPPRFTGYTMDRQVFHVLDNSNTVYKTYTRSELDQLLRQNYFSSSLPPFVPNSGSENGENMGDDDYIDRDPPGDNTVLYVGIGIAALIGLAWWGSKN